MDEEEVREHELELRGNKNLCMPCTYTDVPAKYRVLKINGQEMPPYYKYCHHHTGKLLRNQNPDTIIVIQTI